MVDLQIYSFNVRGIRQKVKRRTVFRHLKTKYPSGVYLLQETHSSTDIEQMWKMDWNGDIYFNHGTTDSCGVAILIFPGMDLSIESIQKDDDGRLLALQIKNDDQDFFLCNLYFPTRDKVQEQLTLLNTVKEVINENECLNTILGGDFNTVFNPEIDKQGGDMNNCTNMYTDELTAFMEAYDLVDAIRLQHPYKKIFTRVQRSPPVLSRIDHWLISSHLINYMNSANALPGIKSDHSIISLHICSSSVNRGRGFWKFNTSLLKDLEYINKVNDIIQNLKDETSYMTDKQLRWDFIKSEIRGYTIQYSSMKIKERRDFKLSLEKELCNIQNELHESMSSSNIDKYQHIKEELEKVEELETKGAILRSKVKWSEAGEKNTKYFLNLEKRNAVEKHICQLQLDNGEITSDFKEILEEQKRFYRTLYTNPCSETSVTEAQFKEFTSNVTSLSQEQQLMCEGLITEYECTKALKNMKNGKSPGCDGFNVEFYKVFWINIKSLFIESINSAYESGKLSFDQRRGIITLIPKKGKKRILLKNWRPISLLNTDYKILTKCLAIRLHGVLPSIINIDQSGFLKDRYIGENIRTIADIIDYTSLKQKPGIILLLDFEKAFDTIRWSFIVDSLKIFNFGPEFIQWIKVLYTDIESTVLNYGHTTGFFKLQRGIRQGCPISPYLFIIAVELLANGVRNNKDIQGINVGKAEIKISQLADDTTVFVSNFDSIEHVLKLIERFHIISGLRLNVDKTVAKCIGSLHNSKCNGKFNLIWTHDPVHTLGITISNDTRTIMNTNFLPRLKVFGNTLDIWNARGLSLKGRVTVLKSLAIPQLLYPMSVLPVPKTIVELVDNMILDFIWCKRKPKIKKDVIVQNINKGGIKVPSFSTMLEANRIGWVNRIVGTSEAKWKHILEDIIQPFTLQDFSECYLDNTTINSIGIPFYVQVYQVWNTVRQLPQCKEEYLEQIIWNNKLIQISAHPKKKLMKSLQWPALYRAGIVKIKHLFTQNFSFIDLTQFCQDNNVRCNFIQTLSVRKAIPSKWITDITSSPDIRSDIDNVNLNINVMGNTVNVCNATTKNLYNCLILRRYVRPTAMDRWLELFDINEDDWYSIFMTPYKATRETKLQSLQYKFIHKIVPCRKWLHVQNIIDSPLCTLCNDNVIDDIIHHFIECRKLHNFWSQLENWWNRTAEYKISLTKKHIIFGFYYDITTFSNINYVIILGKWFIQCQINHEHQVDFLGFLVTLKQHLLTEKYICTSNDKLHIFNKKWSTILENL